MGAYRRFSVADVPTSVVYRDMVRRTTDMRTRGRPRHSGFDDRDAVAAVRALMARRGISRRAAILEVAGEGQLRRIERKMAAGEVHAPPRPVSPGERMWHERADATYAGVARALASMGIEGFPPVRPR